MIRGKRAATADSAGETVPALAMTPEKRREALGSAAPAGRLTLYSSAPGGLASADAAGRLAKYGRNRALDETSPSHLKALIGNFTHTLALLLWFAAGLAMVAGIRELAGAILAVLLVNGTFAFLQEYRADSVVRALTRQVAVSARVLRDGGTTRIPAPDLVPGDVLLVATGDIVPADCALLEAEDLTVDLSVITGETVPVERSSETVPAATFASPPSADPWFLPSGCGVVTGSGTAVVIATGAQSSIGQLASLMTGLNRGQSLLEAQVAALSRTTAIVAVVLGATTLMAIATRGERSFVTALTFGTGVVVALVPEGLLPTLSVSLAIGARRMAQKGAAVRRLSAVEVVGAVTVICTDKTGTLTQNSLSVSSAAFSGDEQARRTALIAAVVCNEASNADEGQPLDRALLAWCAEEGIDVPATRARWPHESTIAFEARRRFSQVSCRGPEGEFTFAKGAPEAITALCSLETLPEELEGRVGEATRRGERVIALAAGRGPDSMRPVAVVGLYDPPRAGVAEAIEQCRSAGIRIVMLTGDHIETARAVGVAVGLPEQTPALEAAKLNEMPEAAVLEFLAGNAIIARVDPEQKLRVVELLRRAGEVVVVTGDGVNDGPALRAADVGIAMGRRGTEVAKQAADIVLADDNFATIVAAIEEGRTIKNNIRRFVSYVFTSNVAEMVPFVAYVLIGIPLPLAVIQALAIDVGTDLLPALGLGTEEPAPDTLNNPPEPPGRPLLTLRLGLLTFLFFGLLESVLGLGAYLAFYWVDGWRPFESLSGFDGAHGGAMTLTFLGIVGGQLGCLAAVRAGTLRQRLRLRLKSWMGLGIAAELSLALAAVYVPGLNRSLSMEAVPLQWFMAAPVAAVLFIGADQLRRGGRSMATSMLRGRAA
ncbi:MAG: cation-translocating P-type ATPase [Dehalococcoidia bacterium]